MQFMVAISSAVTLWAGPAWGIGSRAMTSIASTAPWASFFNQRKSRRLAKKDAGVLKIRHRQSTYSAYPERVRPGVPECIRAYVLLLLLGLGSGVNHMHNALNQVIVTPLT